MNRNCSFIYSQDRTPVIEAVTPVSGWNEVNCQVIKITCFGCSNRTESNTVTIGKVPCKVINVTGNEIFCCPGI